MSERLVEVREVLEEEGLPVRLSSLKRACDLEAYVAVASARTFCPKKLCRGLVFQS